MKTGFLFFVAEHLLVGQLCTTPKSDRSLLSCLKCSISEIGDSPLNKSCSLPIQVMTTGPLLAPSECKSGLPRITGACPGWWKQSFQQRLWSLVWFQVRATSCHLTSSKSALYPSLTCPLLPRPEQAGLLRLVIRREHHQRDLPQYQSQPDRRHPPSIRRDPAGACGKGMLPIPDPYRGGDWGWRRLHE